MDRDQALAWLVERFSTLYAKAGMGLGDVAQGFKPVLDDAWSAVGVPPADPIPSPQIERFRAILKYLAYWHVANTLVNRYSKSVAGVSLQTYQVFQGVKQMMDQALIEAKSHGYTAAHASYQEVILRPARSQSRLRPGGATEMGVPDRWTPPR